MKIKKRQAKSNLTDLENYAKIRLQRVRKAKRAKITREFINNNFTQSQQRVMLKFVIVFFLFICIIRLLSAFTKFNEFQIDNKQEISPITQVQDSITHKLNN